MKSKCCLRLTRCWANGSFSSSLVNRRFWTCSTAKPLTVLRFRARGNYPSHRKAVCPWWHEKELLHCCKRRKIQTVLEFFAVGDSPTAVLFRTVKGGGKLPQHKISTVFKVHLSLFSLARFFIGYLTLSKYSLYYSTLRVKFQLLSLYFETFSFQTGARWRVWNLRLQLTSFSRRTGCQS